MKKSKFISEWYFIYGAMFLIASWCALGKLMGSNKYWLFISFGLINTTMAYSNKDVIGLSDSLINKSMNHKLKNKDGIMLLKIISIFMMAFALINIVGSLGEYIILETIFILISMALIVLIPYFILKEKTIFKKLWGRFYG